MELSQRSCSLYMDDSAFERASSSSSPYSHTEVAIEVAPLVLEAEMDVSHGHCAGVSVRQSAY